MPASISDMLIAFRFKNYRLLWIGVLFGNAARWVFTVGTGWIINTTTHASGLVMTSMLATMLPAVIFGPLVGVLLDKFPPKRILIVGITVSALANCALVCFQLSGRVPIWSEICAAFMVGFGFTIQMTSFNTLIAYVVPVAILPNATLIQGTVNEGTGLAGSILLGPIVSLLGYKSVFVFCFMLYATSLVIVLFTKANVQERPSFIISDGLSEGMKYIIKHPKVLILMALVGFHCILTMCYDVTLPKLISDTFTDSTQVFNTIITLIGIGSIIGVSATVFVSTPNKQSCTFIISGIFSAIGPIFISTLRPVDIVYTGAFLTGLFQTIFMAISLTVVLSEHDYFRGRLSGVYTLVVMGAMATGTLLWGSLQMVMSPRTILFAGACTFIFILIAYAVVSIGILRKTLLSAFSFET